VRRRTSGGREGGARIDLDHHIRHAIKFDLSLLVNKFLRLSSRDGSFGTLPCTAGGSLWRAGGETVTSCPCPSLFTILFYFSLYLPVPLLSHQLSPFLHKQIVDTIRCEEDFTLVCHWPLCDPALLIVIPLGAVWRLSLLKQGGVELLVLMILRGGGGGCLLLRRCAERRRGEGKSALESSSGCGRGGRDVEIRVPRKMSGDGVDRRGGERRGGGKDLREDMLLEVGRVSIVESLPFLCGEEV
jgi:hypothetical protein